MDSASDFNHDPDPNFWKSYLDPKKNSVLDERYPDLISGLQYAMEPCIFFAAL